MVEMFRHKHLFFVLDQAKNETKNHVADPEIIISECSCGCLQIHYQTIYAHIFPHVRLNTWTEKIEYAYNFVPDQWVKITK